MTLVKAARPTVYMTAARASGPDRVISAASH